MLSPPIVMKTCLISSFYSLISMIIDQFYADSKRPPIANNEKKVNVVRPTQRGQQNNGFSNALAKMETRLLNQIS